MLAALLSLVSAFLTYFVVFNIGTLFVDRYYMSTESLAARTASAYTDLYRYVRENGISGGDTEAIERFHQQHGHKHLLAPIDYRVGITAYQQVYTKLLPCVVLCVSVNYVTICDALAVVGKL